MSDTAYKELLRRNRIKVQGRQSQRTAPPPPEEPPGAPWTDADEGAYADALRQLALALNRKEAERAAELQDHIDGLMKRRNRKNEDGTYRFKR